MDPSPQITLGLCHLSPLPMLIMEAIAMSIEVEELQAYDIMIIDVKY
jgi:hypothetical protein